MRRLLLPAFLLLLFSHWLDAQDISRREADPRIEKLVASVSVDRLRQLLATLTSFGTRNTLSVSSSTRGIGAARQWIFDELRRSHSRLQVSVETYRLLPQGRITREAELHNVLAILPGRSARRIYISAHYDSLNTPDQTAGVIRPAPLPPGFNAMEQPGQNHDVDAPGADDNGSGTVLAMELARRFAESELDFDATLVFLLVAGEEQGLFGSRAHAQRIAASGVVVEAVFNNDIVGGSRGGNGVVNSSSVRVYSEGPEDSGSRSLARYVKRVSAIYVPSHRVRPLARLDRFSRGSDHSSFNLFGYPAIVFRESSENLDTQHTGRDTIDGVDFDYLALNVRVNAAAIATLALAPPRPVVTSERGQPLIGRLPSGYDANLRWVASPGAVAYRIYWRDAWANDWEHQQLVGNVTEFVLRQVSIDDVVIGVAAVNADGHESLVSAYVAPARRDAEIKLRN
jgi:hypothetical protein